MQRITFTLEFKQQAVELAESLSSVREAAKQLGIQEACLGRWKRALSPSIGAGAREEDPTAELKRLRRENTEQKKVIHILKSAAAFFLKTT